MYVIFLKFRLSFSVRTRQDSLFVWVCQVSWFPELEYGIFCSFVCVCVFFLSISSAALVVGIFTTSLLTCFSRRVFCLLHAPLSVFVSLCSCLVCVCVGGCGSCCFVSYTPPLLPSPPFRLLSLGLHDSQLLPSFLLFFNEPLSDV